MRRLRMFLAAVVAVTVLAPAGVAWADPTPAVPANPSITDQDVQIEAIQRDVPPQTAGQRSNTSEEPDARTLGLRRQMFKDGLGDQGDARQQAAGPPSTAANVDHDKCRAEDFSYADGGFVIDHYSFCQVTGWDVKLTACSLSLPLLGCVRRKTLGTASFRRTTVGFGWDGTMDSIGSPNPTYSQISFVTVLDQIKTTLAGDTIVVETTIDCLMESNAPCRSLPFERGSKKSIAEWRADGGSFNRFFADPQDGVGQDKLTWFGFENRQVVSGPGATDGDTDEWEGNGFRCDEASYLRGSRGCVFDNVEELFPVTLGPTTNYQEAAQHIFEAHHTPAITYPQVADKNVPGNLNSTDPRPLSRLYEQYEPAIYRDNRAAAVRTCQAQWPGYPANGQDCDEYPMASTYQGASQSNGHYSAKAINLNQNRSLGGTLLGWYTNQRILHEDHFWVVLTVPGGGGGGSGLPDTGPVVSAGPDARGYEGSPIVLRGSARDIEGPVDVQWSYRVVNASKPAMSCEFSSAATAATRITCNDEGTVEVTITADDGTNPAVSDTATVTVLNAPPQLTLEGPEPWQVFRTGTSVNLVAPFTDPGALDTHTCKVVWDDGTIDTYPAQNRTCNRSRTFAHAGMYTISVTVTDDGGASDSSTTMIVVYDPNGAFDNADGKFDSPAGAWTAQPATTGEMNFHLTAKYYNPNTPTGAARAYLANTNLRFDIVADGMEWLVVTPDGKVAAKGTGTINGQSGYGFVYYGYDGCTAGQTTQCQPGSDRFRIVLWPLASGPYPQDEVIYDNRTEAGYDVDVAEPQTLTSGEVNIHPPVTR